MSEHRGEGRRDSVALARFLLSAAAASGIDARRLAREAQLPSWALTAGMGAIDARHVTRIWELIEHALEGGDAALTVARQYRMGALDLYDYLFATAPTLGEGLARSRRYLHLVTTNSILEVAPADDGTVTYSFRQQHPVDRRTDLAQRAAVLMCCDRARAATSLQLAPTRVGFAQTAPRSARRLAEAIGTDVIEFGASATSFTFRLADLDFPLRTADPVLAEILVRYAESVPLPPVTWLEQFREVLTGVMEDGAPCCVDEVARRMAVSVRTLQRRLAEWGTTWSAQLDEMRYRRAREADLFASSTMQSLATRLGYSDVRSVRRAMRRWKDVTSLDSHH